MSWTSIDPEKCNGCQLCVLRCPRCFTKEGETIVAQADISNCNMCGHCIALCKSQAITHTQMNMDNFLPVDEKANFDTDTFIRFIRNRRSHRHFKNKPIPRQELDKLIDACRYAPTGSNVQTVEIVVLQDKEKINHVANQTIDVFLEMRERALKKIEKLKSEGSEVPEYLNRTRLYGERLEEARESGFNPIFYNADTVLFFHSPKDTSTPKDNCVIASTTLSLLARTMGIESTYIGLIFRAVELNRDILDYLQIPPGNELYSVLIMGYPRLNYLYTVDRKPIAARFE